MDDKEKLKEKFYKSFYNAVKEMEYPNGFVAIGYIRNRVCDEVYLNQEEFKNLFYELKDNKFRVVQTHMGLPIHGQGIAPDPYIRLYKIKFY